MAALKSQQAQSFFAKPDPKLIGVLVHGSEPGLVAEIAQLAAERLAARDTPPGEIIRIEDAEIEAEPDRLSTELQTIAMFGGRKVVRTTLSRRIGLAQLSPLIEAGQLEGAIVVESNALKADDKVRALFEKSPVTVAFACYADAPRDLGGLVTEVLAEARIGISPEARQLLVSRLGADRILSRAEIEKLALYAAGRTSIEVDDIEAIVGDAAELAIDRIVIAAASGEAREAVHEFDRSIAAGESAQLVISSLLRYIQRLERVRAAMDNGRTFDDAIRSLRPPVFFKQKDALAAQVRIWTGDQLSRARVRISETQRVARTSGDLEDALAERVLLEVAGLAAQGLRTASRSRG
jgi:DNA polymerase-3 subunit delta